MTKDITKNMLDTIRESISKTEKENSKPNVEYVGKEKEMNFLEEADYLMSRHEKKSLNESIDNEGEEFVINKSTPQFGDVYESQTSALLKTIGEGIDFGEKALVFYPQKKDLTLSGKITSINIAFQLRYSDPSGEGIYIWMNGCQLTEPNLRTVSKIRDAFLNWKQSLVQNSDLIDKLSKVCSRQ